jgi:hypothetical protein
METSALEANKPIGLWKRIAIRSAVGGMTCGVVLIIGAAVAVYFANRPKEWNDRALKVVHSEAHPFDRWGDDLKEESSGITFDVDIQNTTGVDINIAQDLSIMSQTRSTHALKGTFLQLGHAYFIPARHTVSVSMGSTELCAADYDPRKCFESYFKDSDALVIFDGIARLKISIPMPSLTYDPTTRYGAQ